MTKDSNEEEKKRNKITVTLLGFTRDGDKEKLLLSKSEHMECGEDLLPVQQTGSVREVEEPTNDEKRENRVDTSCDVTMQLICQINGKGSDKGRSGSVATEDEFVPTSKQLTTQAINFVRPSPVF